MTPDEAEENASGPGPRLRSAMERLVRDDGARVGFVLDGSGHVTAAAGHPGELDPVGFAALAAAQAWAAQDLAPIVAGVEFSGLFQCGRGTTVALHALAGDRLLALLYDHAAGEARPAAWMVPDVTEVSRAVVEFDGWNAEAGSGPGRQRDDWAREAEDRIDRIFKGEG